MCAASPRVRLFTILSMVAALSFAFLPATQAETGSIFGTAYQDLDRNGSKDPGESPFEGHQLYLFDSAGTFRGTSVTAADGTYSFGGFEAGDYVVKYASPSWWPIREQWVPTTTGSVFPNASVHLAGMTRVDFGWRTIVTSTDLSLPVSTYTGSNGLRVDAYNDAVAARDIFDALMQAMVGAEARFIQVRFAYGTANMTASGGGTGPDGRYAWFSAASYVSYESWLDGGDQTLDHEYGHAWSGYYSHIVQQDPSLAGYLLARGLAGDSRVGTSYEWDPKEIIAEDYRQLFGSANGRSAAHMNSAIPPAAMVPGLRDYLSTTFIGAAPTPPPSPTPTPTPTATATPTSTPTPTPSSTPVPSLTVTGLSVSPVPVKRSALVSFALSAPATVTVTIVDATGALVRTLASSAPLHGGTRSFAWDRTDSRGRRVRSGSYRVTVRAANGLSSITTTGSFTVG